MDSIVNLIVFHRKLGCIDEAATDEEQGEKVLYYYPTTPLYDQLGKINMLEGLIEFSCKFALSPEDDVNIVTMEMNTWVFFQCEPEIWIICGIANKPCRISSSTGINSNSKDNLSFNKQTPNGASLLVAIKKMYEIYAQFNGSIECSIAEHNGWNVIDKVASLRKKRRKCDQARRQLMQDIDSLNWQREQQEQKQQRAADAAATAVGSEHQTDGVDSMRESLRQSVVSEDAGGQQLGYRADMGSMEELEAKAVAVDADIRALTSESLLLATGDTYSPTRTRNRLSNFLDMYVYAGELLFPSLFHDMAGVHLAPVGHPAFQALLAVRQAISSGSNNKVIGSVILHDGDVIWTDVDDCLVQNISTFIRIQEYAYIRNSFRWSFATKDDKLSSSNATSPIKPSGLSTETQRGQTTTTTTATTTAGVVRAVRAEEDDAGRDYDTEGDGGDGTATDGTADADLPEEEDDEDDGEEVEGFFDEHGAASHEDTSDPCAATATEVVNEGGDIGVSGGDELPKRNKTLKEKFKDRMQKLMTKGKGSEGGEGAAQAKARQEMEEEWLQQMLQRSGFVSQYWTSLDLHSGNNPSNHDAMNRSELQFVKEFEYMLRRSGSVATRRASLNLSATAACAVASNSGHVYDKETLGMCVGSNQKVFCPILYNASSDSGTLASRQPGAQYSKVGRLVIYRQDRFLIALLVEDWTCSDSTTENSDCSDSSGKKLVNPFESGDDTTSTGSAGGGAVTDDTSKFTTKEPATVTINSVVTSLLTMCRHIQRSVHGELGSLYSALGQPVVIMGVPPRKRYHLPPSARLIYYNKLNAAVKIGNIYKHKADPVLVWPFNIQNTPVCLVKQNEERNYSLLNQERLETSASPALMTRLSDLRPRFNLPPGLLAQSMESMLCAALNECWMNSEGHNTHDCDVIETCIRVRATYKGGLWVIAKKTAQRSIYLALERCSTLSDAHETLNMTTSGVLSSVFI